jgi:uncharacterized protein YukE
MTSITVEYDRQLTDSKVAAILDRATDTLSVLAACSAQIGVEYETLPGYASADYQTEADALQAKVGEVNALLAQLPALLHDIDDLGAPMDDKNKGCYATLKGLLKDKPQEDLLNQIDLN